MERSVIATSDRFYRNYTYQRITKARVTGGKLENTVVAEYENCPLVWVHTRGRRKFTEDGNYQDSEAKAHIASRFFEVNEFTPSLNDCIMKDGIKWRVVNLRDYTYHPHIDVWTLTLKRIEYHV